MSPLLMGLLGLGLMLMLIAIRMPVGFAMGVSGFLGIAVLYDGNWTAAAGSLGIVPYAMASNYIFTTVPLFILMGEFAFRSGISAELFVAARHWMGHLPGGLAMASIGTCAGFAAASGSSVATAAAIGTITIPEMRRGGVHPRLATAACAAGGTLGIMIPPSLGMVIYGLTADQSIGRLLVAGIIPGILLTLAMILAVLWVAWRDPGAAPRQAASSWPTRLRATRGVAGILALFALVMGGIYGGVFTPTEAAAVGALGSLGIALIKRQLTWRGLMQALLQTGITTCMIFIIIIGSHILNIFLSATGFPAALSKLLTGLALPPAIVIALIVAIYVVLGCFLDVLAMIVLTVPIVLPVVIGLGYDPIWFGVVIVLVMEIALITPPVGMNVYVIKSVVPDVRLGTIFSGIWPFLVSMIIVVALLILLPDVTLFLPRLMF
ncbi:MAG: TRAP transporter large permease [Burkholderiaceae bacterium]|nr:TRAP transporter large permease [Burkholderiaceae bacterium]